MAVIVLSFLGNYKLDLANATLHFAINFLFHMIFRNLIRYISFNLKIQIGLTDKNRIVHRYLFSTRDSNRTLTSRQQDIRS